MFIEKLTPGKVIETAETEFKEDKLLIGILWEGDLEIHTNASAASTTPFGACIAHGDSVLAISLGSLFKTKPLFGLRVELQKVCCSFTGPVYVGDVLKARFEITKAYSRENDNIVEADFITVKNGHTPVLSGKCSVVVHGRVVQLDGEKQN